MSKVEYYLIRPLALWFGRGVEPSPAQIIDMIDDYQGYSEDDFKKAVRWVKQEWDFRDRFPPPKLIIRGLESYQPDSNKDTIIPVEIERGSEAWTDWDIAYCEAYEDGYITEKALKDFKKLEKMIVPRKKPSSRKNWHYYQNWKDAQELKEDRS